MLSLFKKLFAKSDPLIPGPLAPAPSATSPAQMQFESAVQMAKVEVARLSLKAIVAKLPEDVRALLTAAPDEATTVALPIQTILKQLHSGVVRMSLASLHRQAPAGLFKPLPAGDKRMVEVPLAEVFKHVKPTALKRRNDQRQAETVDEDFDSPVFNSRVESKPAAPIAKAPPAEEVAVAAEPTPTAMRTVAPPSEFSIPTSKPEPKAAAVKAIAPPEQAEPATGGDALRFPLAQLSQAWPAEIREVLGALDAATHAAIPHTHIAPGLARGKIACTWRQLRAWLTPAAPADVAIEAETTLLLPLKVIAPAFLAHKKPAAAQRKGVTLDESIPALFSGGKAQPESQPAPSVPETPAAPEAPCTLKLEAKEPAAPPAEPAATAQSLPETECAEPSATPEAAAAPPPDAETPAPQTLGEVLGEPDRKDWTPAALTKAVAQLPGVAGSVLALQEGFQVAHALPDGVNAETVSAFLPQLFTRLNQYAGEMKLGEVDDLLFTTRGAHCMIYRLGALYFAVLGQPGETLPWNAMRLVAAELSRQAQK